jgi:hypothetical protein
MRLEVLELCQTESGTGILNQLFAKKLPDKNPENLLSLCCLLADQGILLFLWHPVSDYFSFTSNGLTVHAFRSRCFVSGNYSLIDSVTDNKCGMLLSANEHVWLLQAELSILTTRIRHQLQPFVRKGGTCWGSWQPCLKVQECSPYFRVVGDLSD